MQDSFIQNCYLVIYGMNCREFEIKAEALQMK
jgi:hypothetical protein